MTFVRSAGINMTPAAQRAVSLDEETLLGGPRKRRKPIKLYALAAVVLLLVLLVVGFRSLAASPPPSSGIRAPDGHGKQGKGKHDGKPAGLHGGHKGGKGVGKTFGVKAKDGQGSNAKSDDAPLDAEPAADPKPA